MVPPPSRRSPLTCDVVAPSKESEGKFMMQPVRGITVDEIRDARDRIGGTILRTPLVRLDLGRDGPDIRLKLENLQPTNAYKIRGAANAVARLSAEEKARGVWTISAGN